MIKNKSKPWALLGVALLIGTLSQSQTMFVKKINNIQNNYSLASIKKLSFTTTNMKVQKNDNTEVATALNNISYLNFIQNTVGIKESFNNERVFLKTYPNPVEYVLNIDFADVNLGNATISILSLDGKLLLTANVSGKKDISINLSQLAQGVYICQLKTDKELKRTKLIKQ